MTSSMHVYPTLTSGKVAASENPGSVITKFEANNPTMARPSAKRLSQSWSSVSTRLGQALRTSVSSIPLTQCSPSLRRIKLAIGWVVQSSQILETVISVFVCSRGSFKSHFSKNLLGAPPTSRRRANGEFNG
jgi:hypothetical protein